MLSVLASYSPKGRCMLADADSTHSKRDKSNEVASVNCSFLLCLVPDVIDVHENLVDAKLFIAKDVC